MGLTFTPLHPVFVAECSGVDIGEPLSPENAAAIEGGMDRYAVLVFRRGTPLTTAQQLASCLPGVLRGALIARARRSQCSADPERCALERKIGRARDVYE
jgi:alpha-ketoglutarate-dependent taurine dioxygenase